MTDTTYMVRGKEYLRWTNAGGPNECEHGYAEGIDCPQCDANPKIIALKAELEKLRGVYGAAKILRGIVGDSNKHAASCQNNPCEACEALGDMEADAAMELDMQIALLELKD